MLRSSVSTPISDHQCLMRDWKFLPHRVGRRLVDDGKAHAVLVTDAVGPRHPAGLVEDTIGAFDILNQAGVVGGRRVDRRRRNDVAGRASGEAVADLDQDLAVDGHGKRLADGMVGQEGMGVGPRGALVAPVGRGVGEVDDEAFDQGSETRHHDTLARGLHALQHVRGKLQVPRIVELAGLEDRAARRRGIAAALERDGGERRFGRIAIVRVGFERDDVVRAEFGHAERSGADRIEVGLGALGRPGAHALGELRLLEDGRAGGRRRVHRDRAWRCRR